MSNREHLEIILKGPEIWNHWRKEVKTYPDLTGAIFSRVNLKGMDLHRVNFSRASFERSDLRYADLTRANLSETQIYRSSLRGANLHGANFTKAQFKWSTLERANLNSANLMGATFIEVSLCRADLAQANLCNANLSGANLRYARLVDINLQRANIEGCSIYGISAWNVQLDGANQFNLNVSRPGEPTISVDNLEVAQFIYLLLNNKKIRDVINTVTSRVVLILGRFTPERKTILDVLRERLRARSYVPVLVDFDKPDTRNLTETLSILAHLAKFVIADITDAKSIPQELQRIVPNLPSLPIQPLLLSTEYEYGMFNDFADYPWVLPLYKYDSLDHLIASLEGKVILPAVTKVMEIDERRKLLHL